MNLLSSYSHCNERVICVESLCHFHQSDVCNRSDSLVLNDTPDFQRQRHRGIYFIPCDATRSGQIIAIPAVPDVFAFEYGPQDLQIQCCNVADMAHRPGLGNSSKPLPVSQEMSLTHRPTKRDRVNPTRSYGCFDDVCGLDRYGVPETCALSIYAKCQWFNRVLVCWQINSAPSELRHDGYRRVMTW